MIDGGQESHYINYPNIIRENDLSETITNQNAGIQANIEVTADQNISLVWENIYLFQSRKNKTL